MSGIGAIGGPAPAAVAASTNTSGNFENSAGKMAFGCKSKVALQIDNLFADLLLLLLLQVESSARHPHPHAIDSYQAARSMVSSPAPAISITA